MIAAPSFSTRTRQAAARAAESGPSVHWSRCPRSPRARDLRAREPPGAPKPSLIGGSTSLLGRLLRVLEGAAAPVSGAGGIRPAGADYLLYMRGERAARISVAGDEVAVAIALPERRSLRVHGGFASVAAELPTGSCASRATSACSTAPPRADALVERCADEAHAGVTARWLPWNEDGRDRSIGCIDIGGRPVGAIRSTLGVAGAGAGRGLAPARSGARDLDPGAVGSPHLRVGDEIGTRRARSSSRWRVRSARARFPPSPRASCRGVPPTRAGERDEADALDAEARAERRRAPRTAARARRRARASTTRTPRRWTRRPRRRAERATPRGAAELERGSFEPESEARAEDEPREAPGRVRRARGETGEARGERGLSARLGAVGADAGAAAAGARSAGRLRTGAALESAGPRTRGREATPRTTRTRAARARSRRERGPKPKARRSSRGSGEDEQLEASSRPRWPRTRRRLERGSAAEPVEVSPPRMRRQRAAILVRDDPDSILAGLVLARDRRTIVSFRVAPQEGLMDFFKGPATDIADNVDVLVVGFSAQPRPKEVLDTAELFRGRLQWFDHHEWAIEDSCACAPRSARLDRDRGGRLEPLGA
jgi:hypothetical protein